jgi:hypothetical protein
MLACVPDSASPSVTFPVVTPQIFDTAETLLAKALQPKTLDGSPISSFPTTLPSGVSGIALRSDGGVAMVEKETSPGVWSNYWILRDGEYVFFPGALAVAWRVQSVSGTPTVYVSHY